MIVRQPIKPLAAAIVALVLSACGDSETQIHAQDIAEPGHDHEHEDEHDHEDEHAGSARLLLSAQDGTSVHVFEAGTGEAVADLTLPAPVSAVYPVPGYRFGAFIHRDDNWVSFVDGGLWEEEHGDHFDTYTETPAVTDFFLDGVKPTHYTLGQTHAAVFYDGNADTDDPAGVATFGAPVVADNGVAPMLTLATHMHGAAQVRGEHLFVAEREVGAESTLPDRVTVFHRHDSEYERENTFEARCPGLHGSAQNEGHLFFGCTDGVLVVDLEGEASARKIANGEVITGDDRVGSLSAHHHSHDAVAVADGEFYLVDPAEDALEPLALEFPEGVSSAAYGFVMGGEAFAVLRTDGELMVLDSHDWTEIAHVEVVAEPAADSLALVRPPQGHQVYVLDSAGQQVLPVDLEAGAVGERWSVDFGPAAGVWVGLAEGEHAHEH